MRKTLTIAMIGLTLLATTGCGSGPIGRFFRGGACNTCRPAIGQSLFGRGGGNCESGVCGDSQGTYDGGLLPGPAQTQPDSFGVDPNTSGVIYGQPSYDPFSATPAAPSVTQPSTTNVLPGPR